MTKTIKTSLLSVSEMYEADRKTIESGISGVQLMEAAGGAIAHEIRQRWTPRKTVILCGPGNNGGDGFVVARLLHQKGWYVRIALLGKRENLKGDAKINSDRWPFDTVPLTPESISDADLIVDAVFGAGLARNIDGTVADTLCKAMKMDIPVVAVDTPSGIHGDTGQILGTTLSADLTVTFCRGKTGHYLYPARQHCGELVIADIGIPDSVINEINPDISVNSPAYLFPWPKEDGHKYNKGHGVIVGGQHMTGAARLAATCARRVGAGLITIAAHGAAYTIYRQADAGNLVSDEPLHDILSDPRKNCVLVGPGLGIGQGRKTMVQRLLSTDKALVIDADALTMLADIKWPKRNAETLLTPHEGEFSRLFPNIKGSKLERTRLAAKESGCTILLKGADTVIAAPNGMAAINTTGTPWLATAGSGDSLAGICLGFMTQGLDAFEAGKLSSWLHGRCAEAFGEGLIAEDICGILPSVIKTVKKTYSSC